MITVSELRIGNIVHPESSDPTQVATISGVEIGKLQFYECEPGTPENAAPVTISLLWLQGYGFKREGGLWTKGLFKLLMSENQFLFAVDDHSFPVLYIHQLQNLYFLIVGEELMVEFPEESPDMEIELAADSIMVNYLPNDKAATSFTFKLSIEGKMYEVLYVKDDQGYWSFQSYTRT